MATPTLDGGRGTSLCFDNQENPSWFYEDVQQATKHEVDVSNSSQESSRDEGNWANIVHMCSILFI